MKVMNIVEARASGYRAVTFGYRWPEELGMLDRTLGDMRRGQIDHMVVRDGDGLAVWRRGASQAAGDPKAENRGPKDRSLVTPAAMPARRVAA